MKFMRGARAAVSRSISMVSLCAALCLPTVAMAQAPSAGEDARTQGEVSRLSLELGQQIYSPFCPGKTLQMCTSPNAAAVRREIQDKLREGKTPDQIKTDIIDSYGEEFRMVEPPASDNIALFVALAIGLLLALTAVYVMTRRRKTDAPGQAMGDEQGVGEEEDLSEDEKAYLDELRKTYRDD